MKTLRVLAVTAALLATGSAMASDQVVVTDEGVGTFSFFKPFGVRVEGGTTGYGGALVYSASQNTDLVLGYNGGEVSWSDDISVNGVKYDLEMDNNTTYLNVQMRPFANSFHVAAGVAYTDNEYAVTGRQDGIGFFTIDGTRYEAADVKQLAGKVKYKNDIVPYVGIGFSPAITDRIGFFGQIGAYYTGNPDVSLNSVGGNLNAVGDDPNGKTLGQAIANERREIAEDDTFKFQPVAKAGITLRF
ncbi:MAG: hypothetical protein VXW65_13260 [Pseudomonadota bacterium]|nr:hypothetical protein [Pseudomonadota bacterium]